MILILFILDILGISADLKRRLYYESIMDLDSFIFLIGVNQMGESEVKELIKDIVLPMRRAISQIVLKAQQEEKNMDKNNKIGDKSDPKVNLEENGLEGKRQLEKESQDIKNIKKYLRHQTSHEGKQGANNREQDINKTPEKKAVYNSKNMDSKEDQGVYSSLLQILQLMGNFSSEIETDSQEIKQGLEKRNKLFEIDQSQTAKEMFHEAHKKLIEDFQARNSHLDQMDSTNFSRKSPDFKKSGTTTMEKDGKIIIGKNGHISKEETFQPIHHEKYGDITYEKDNQTNTRGNGQNLREETSQSADQPSRRLSDQVNRLFANIYGQNVSEANKIFQNLKAQDIKTQEHREYERNDDGVHPSLDEGVDSIYFEDNLSKNKEIKPASKNHLKEEASPTIQTNPHKALSKNEMEVQAKFAEVQDLSLDESEKQDAFYLEMMETLVHAITESDNIERIKKRETREFNINLTREDKKIEKIEQKYKILFNLGCVFLTPSIFISISKGIFISDKSIFVEKMIYKILQPILTLTIDNSNGTDTVKKENILIFMNDIVNGQPSKYKEEIDDAYKSRSDILEKYFNDQSDYKKDLKIRKIDIELEKRNKQLLNIFKNMKAEHFRNFTILNHELVNSYTRFILTNNERDKKSVYDLFNTVWF